MNWVPVLVAAGFALAAFVAAELAARAHVRRRGRFDVWEPGFRLEQHLEPGVIPTQGPLVRFSVNRDGERGDEPPPPSPDVYRVLVAGGSAAECYFLDQPQSWPEVMKRELSRPERLAALGVKRVHVGNIGKSLVATEFVDEILARILPRYPRLDCLVLMIGASNVVGWLMTKTPAVLREGAAPPSDVFAVRADRPYAFHPAKLALRELLARRLRRGKTAVRHGAGKKLLEIRAMRRRAPVTLDETPDPAVMLDHFERAYRALLRRAKAAGVRVVVAPQPWMDKPVYAAEEQAAFWHGSQGQPYLEDVKVYYTDRVVGGLMHAVERRMAAVAAEEGVECAPVRPMVEPSLASYYDYFHLTPDGAEQVGRGLADVVARSRPRA
jgi:lysophospholipase L1-like esterase